MRRVLATDFAIWPMLQNLHLAAEHMVVSADYRARLANYLLMYDQVVIPTGNLQILPVLRLVLGESGFNEVIASRAVVLARFDQWFGYMGDGSGLGFFTISEREDWPSDRPNLGTAFFKSLDEAIATSLRATNPPSSVERQGEITNLLLDNVVQLPSQSIAQGLKEEAYKDILGSPLLREFFSLNSHGTSLDKLPGLAANKLMTFNPHVSPERGDSPRIRAVLRVVFENLLLSMGGQTDSTEVTGDDATVSVLRAKGQRLGYSPNGSRAFTEIQKISGVPDIGAAFAARQLSATQILALRNSKHTQALRDWFALGAAGETQDETVRRFVSTIAQPSLIDSLPAKLVRLAATTGIGVLEPISGAIASSVDSLLLSKWFPGRSPRLFLKEAKTLIANAPTIKPPKKPARNDPCSCGSDLKYKKCCGRVM